MSSVVLTERNGKVLEITMNRPPVNAINSEMTMALYDAFSTLRDDPALTVGLITRPDRGERRIPAHRNGAKSQTPDQDRINTATAPDDRLRDV